jgi:hypothetical protein
VKRIAAIAALAAGLAIGAGACNLKLDDAPDAGAHDSGASTIGDQCTRIYVVLCGKAINTCKQQGYTIDQCVASNKTSCCVDKCDKPALSTDDQVSACANAVAAEACSDIQNNALPGECNGVPKLQ